MKTFTQSTGATPGSSKSKIRSQSYVEEDAIDLCEELDNPGYVIPEIDTREFMDYLLPPLKSGIVLEDVLSSLKHDGLVGLDGRWKAFGTTRRRRTRQLQGKSFAHLVHIFERTATLTYASSPHLRQTVEMVLFPRRRRRSGRKVRFPGGYFILKDGRESGVAGKGTKRKARSWFDVALTAEFGKDNNDQYHKETSVKVISDIQKTLAQDPCRRFAFGITAEGKSMRLWFCPHGTPVVSKEFDFTKDLRLLTHVFLSLAFASKEELGWDPTVRSVTSSTGKQVYHIDVGNETYETIHVLADSASEKLDSHATRVWKVQRPDTESSYVLKDVWLDDGQQPEHAIYDAILNDIEGKYGTDVREKTSSHLLTPMKHCLVPVNGKEDHTARVMMRGYVPSFRQKLRIDTTKLDYINGDGSEVPSSANIVPQAPHRTFRAPLPWYNPDRKILSRRHYRVVFKEVAETLYHVRDLANAFTVLSDSAKVLKWIHGCGWVHRDLSVGNLYLYEGRGLIGDLEYAKRRNVDVSGERRAGTPYFTAVEAARRSYEHLPAITMEQMDAAHAALREGREEELELLYEPPPNPAFFHSDLHDLESLWWIAIWELFYGQISPEATPKEPQDIEKDRSRRRAAYDIFTGDDTIYRRRMFLQNKDVYYSQMAWTPEYLRSILVVLNALRGTLVRKYLEFEAGFPRDIRVDVFEGTAEKIKTLFEKCREHTGSMKDTPHRENSPRVHCNENSDVKPKQTASTPSTECPGQPSKPDPPLVAMTNRPSSEKEVDTTTSNAHGARNCMTRPGKRKRDDDDALMAMRPLRMARLGLEVC